MCGGVCYPSEEFRCSPQAAAASPLLTSPRTAELSGLCAPLWEATLGGRGWSAWLLLFVEKLLKWVRQKGRLLLLQPWGSAVLSGAFLAYCLVLHLLCCCSLEPLGPTGHCFNVPGHTHILGPMSPAGSKPQTTTLGQREHRGTQRLQKSYSLPCGQASDMPAGPPLHLRHPRPQAPMAWLSEVKVVCSGCTGHPRGLLSRACPTAQSQSPGDVASPWPPRPPQLFVTLVFCPQAAPLPKCPC